MHNARNPVWKPFLSASYMKTAKVSASLLRMHLKKLSARCISQFVGDFDRIRKVPCFNCEYSLDSNECSIIFHDTSGVLFPVLYIIEYSSSSDCVLSGLPYSQPVFLLFAKYKAPDQTDSL